MKLKTTLNTMKSYKLIVLEPCGKFYTKRCSFKELMTKYRLKDWLFKRLIRGEEWYITSNVEVFPIGSKVLLLEREPLLSRLKKLLTTKVRHLFN